MYILQYIYIRYKLHIQSCMHQSVLGATANKLAQGAVAQILKYDHDGKCQEVPAEENFSSQFI